MTANNLHDDWWKQAVVYQIYPAQLQGRQRRRTRRHRRRHREDGLPGRTSASTRSGSPRSTPPDLADGGYDVIDYRNVDPRLGTMDDFDAMAEAAHEAGIKVIVDIVPNHTADKHVVLQRPPPPSPALGARPLHLPRRPRRARRTAAQRLAIPLRRPGVGARGRRPVVSAPVRQGAADVNWKNPDIHEEFKKTLRFWSDHGTDGFRIDVAHGLAKDLESKPLGRARPRIQRGGGLNRRFQPAVRPS